jgi:tetratricopeptide (TPR) repeat protein
VWAGASVALAYTYMEEREYDKAIAECLALKQEYPNSIINNMLLGRVYTKSKDYDAALAAFEDVRQTDPGNRRVLWHIGDCYYKTRRHNDEAAEFFQMYLETRIPDMYRCHSHYRLGQIAQRKKDYPEAERQFLSALEADPKYGPAKRRLEKVREKMAGPS